LSKQWFTQVSSKSILAYIGFEAVVPIVFLNAFMITGKQKCFYIIRVFRELMSSDAFKKNEPIFIYLYEPDFYPHEIVLDDQLHHSSIFCHNFAQCSQDSTPYK
jgi:hypothetical protein